MNLKQYLGKDIRVTFVDGHVLEGHCHTFTGRLDTEDELYDEITIETDIPTLDLMKLGLNILK